LDIIYREIAANEIAERHWALLTVKGEENAKHERVRLVVGGSANRK